MAGMQVLCCTRPAFISSSDHDPGPDTSSPTSPPRFSYCLLLYCRQLSSRKTYEDLAAQALGPAGLHLIRWSEASLNLGTTGGW